MDKEALKMNIIRQLKALGAYYRADWSGFDGRTLRNELDGFCKEIEKEDFSNTFTKDLIRQSERF